ncbi:Calmodulin-binding transcription activator 1 [Collichthys lucidus]|uniref:Calmodulin-binding transcription activator 1 n=1 Tax=Collichthys lucidus TaxID=240159 RepID=A0A4U5UQM0_COLLU|nr:Calmodulin-binding transcription activator 1 [Collichthys lucidus]
MEALPLSVLLGWAVSRGEQTSCCIDDEEDVQRGRQRSDSHGVPGMLHISTEPPTRLKVLPEVRARGKAREREIEDERGVIESLHKTHPSRHMAAAPHCEAEEEIAAYLITFEKHEEWLTTSPKTSASEGH